MGRRMEIQREMDCPEDQTSRHNMKEYLQQLMETLAEFLLFEDQGEGEDRALSNAEKARLMSAMLRGMAECIIQRGLQSSELAR